MAVGDRVCLREDFASLRLILLLVGGERRRGCAGLVRREGQLTGQSGLQHVGGRQPLSVMGQSRTRGVIGRLGGVGPDGPVLHLPLSFQQRLETKMVKKTMKHHSCYRNVSKTRLINSSVQRSTIRSGL